MMNPTNVRLRGFGLFIMLDGLVLLGAAVPLGCNHSGGPTALDAGATGGANGGAPVDAAMTGGSGGQLSDGATLDIPVDSSDGGSPGAGTGGSATGGKGGGPGQGGAGMGGGGAAGGSAIDAGAPDRMPADSGMDQQSAGGAAGDGSAGIDGALADGGAADVIFPCGPCAINWVCGGVQGTPYTYVTLVSEDDGCYLSGLGGHKLLATDGTITENGVQVGSALKLGPQVALSHADGSDWLYCGGNLPCNGTQ